MSVQNISWVEKHRPETLDEIIGHDAIINRMGEWVEDPEVPHVLLAGPAGTGKTTLVTAFAREKFGEDAWRSNVLELNASDDRGIDTVRDRVKSFARTSTVGDYEYSIVFLDEVDSMTDDAQSALRRIMEDFSDTTRFFLSCNYKNQIIDPIQSRCTPMIMSSLEDAEIKQILRNIAAREGVEVEDDSALDLIVNDCRGDARKAITRLQKASMNGEISEESTKAFVDVVDYSLVNDIIKEAAGGDLDSAMERLDSEVLKQGVSPQKFVETALWIVQDMDLPEDAKAKIMDHLGEVDRAINQGGHAHVQIHAWLAKVMTSRHLSLPNYDDEQ